MKKTVVVLAILFMMSLLFAQASWNWAKGVGGSSFDSGQSIAVDASGNSYVTGYFIDSADFGSISLTSNGNSDILVAKMDANGNWLWAVSVGASDWDGGFDICLDSEGNAYVTGYFNETVSFGTYELTSNGVNDVFVAKISSAGVWQWAKNAGSSSNDFGYGIEIDATGNLYVTGWFAGTASFGSYSVISAGDDDVFIAKLNSSGNWLGVLSAGGSNKDRSTGIGLANSGNAYITGEFSGSTTFGSISLTEYGNRDIFVAKANSTLTSWQWAKNAGGTNEDKGYAIKTDGSGNSYVTGYYIASATFGSELITALGNSDIFVSKLNTNGDWLWAISAGGSDYDIGYGIDIDATGNSYITGIFSYTCSFGSHDVTTAGGGGSDIFVSKLNATGDEWLWAMSAGGSGSDTGNAIFKSNDDFIHAIGSFKDAADFGSTHLTSNGYDDIFVAKLQESSMPSTPENVQIIINGNQVQLSWNEVSGCTYTVYSDTDPEGDFSNVEQTGITATNWTGSVSGTKKFYIVRAKN